MIIEKFLTGPLQVNTYLVIDNSTNKGFLVDPGGFSTRIVEEINKKNVEIEYIILTHGHGDHIGGVSEFLNMYKNAKVVSSEGEKDMLSNPSLNFSMETCGFQVKIIPDILVKDNEVIMVGNLSLKFIMTPGHTKGGMCILVDNFLFSGDTLFRQSVGRTDFPGGSLSELKNSIVNKLFLLESQVQVLPGHMDATTIGFEMRNNPFV